MQKEEREHQRPQGYNYLIELHFTSLLSTETRRAGGGGKYESDKKYIKIVLPDWCQDHVRKVPVRTDTQVMSYIQSMVYYNYKKSRKY